MQGLSIEFIETSEDPRVMFLVGMLRELRQIPKSGIECEDGALELKQHFARIVSFLKTAQIEAELGHISIKSDFPGSFRFEKDKKEVEGAILAICATIMAK